MRAPLRILCVGLALLFVAGISAAPAKAEVGIVLLHGKFGAPDKHIDVLASALRSAGYLVSTPEMPWSKRRNYDAGFLAGLAEVDLAVRGLRAKGASQVLVGGHSLGGNAALAYAARYPGLAGVVCLAAAHTPDIGRALEISRESVAQARALVAAGKGASQARFTDLNMGKPHDMVVSAEVYLSYYDPQGPAAMPVSAGMIQPPLPILWIAGALDPLSRPGPGYAFDRAPAHPQSRYATVDADHLGTPTAAAPLVLEWLKALPR
ncbi:alpha/beta fold hydrolase [Humidesulfovibrio idahonensis]